MYSSIYLDHIIFFKASYTSPNIFNNTLMNFSVILIGWTLLALFDRRLQNINATSSIYHHVHY